MFKKAIYYGQLVIILLLFWIALFETVDPKSLLLAITVILLVIVISERFFMASTFYTAYPFNLIKLSLFFFVLVYEIYAAGFATLLRIITGHINPGIVDITTELPSDFQKSILANAITLTPGTVSLDLNKNSIKVLWLDVLTKNPTMAGQIIKGNLEKFLH